LHLLPQPDQRVPLMIPPCRIRTRVVDHASSV
jgi:hypothetical protein